MDMDFPLPARLEMRNGTLREVWIVQGPDPINRHWFVAPLNAQTPPAAPLEVLLDSDLVSIDAIWR